MSNVPLARLSKRVVDCNLRLKPRLSPSSASATEVCIYIHISIYIYTLEIYIYIYVATHVLLHIYMYHISRLKACLRRQWIALRIRRPSAPRSGAEKPRSRNRSSGTGAVEAVLGQTQKSDLGTFFFKA